MMAVSGRQDSAKVFMSGLSQAVRLPKKFRFSKECAEVAIRQVGTAFDFESVLR